MNLQQMKYYKHKKGYSYAQLSELSGVPLGTIQKIFRGETKSPRHATLVALEKVLAPRDEADMLREPAVWCDTGKDWYTLEDYYALPDDQRAELIDGMLFTMAAPSLMHQMISMEASYKIKDFIRRQKGNCVVLAAPVDVQLDCDERTMVEPDIVIVCDRDKLTDRCIMGAPDFILEILSPATRQKDMFLKLTKYRNAGVQEYWMVDLEKARVIAYFFEEDEIPVIYGLGESIPVKIFGGELNIDFSEAEQSQGAPKHTQ